MTFSFLWSKSPIFMQSALFNVQFNKHQYYVINSVNVGDTIFCNNQVPFASSWLVGWLCLTSHRQRGHLETAPPLTVPCEGHEAR